jgi:hypothetical protein
MTAKKKLTGGSRKSATVQKKSSAKPNAGKKNKLGVKNSLVNNINAKKKRGTSQSKKKSTVSKKAYKKMQNNWGRKKRTAK